jgi:Fic family protein
MQLFPPEEIRFNKKKSQEIKSVMEATFRLIVYSRSHLADDLLNAYINKITSFKTLLSIKNAQMEAQNEEEANQYTSLLNVAVDFITEEIKEQTNFGTELQLFQLFRLISPEAHATHPNRYRDRIVQIGRYICPEPAHVPGLVNDLFYTLSTMEHPIMKAIYFHHELIRIHPFADGNGRTVRMAKNWILMYELYPPIFISGVAEKRVYIDTLEQSFGWILQHGCSWNPFIESFFEQELDRLLRNATLIHEQVRKAGNLREV